jgi:hypothetical protein
VTAWMGMRELMDDNAVALTCETTGYCLISSLRQELKENEKWESSQEEQSWHGGLDLIWFPSVGLGN